MPSVLLHSRQRPTPPTPPHDKPPYHEYLASRLQHLLLPLGPTLFSPNQEVDWNPLDQCSHLPIDVSHQSDHLNTIKHPPISGGLKSYPLVGTGHTTRIQLEAASQPQSLLEKLIPSPRSPSDGTQWHKEKSTGGVAAHLDYEMQQMIDFVADMVQGMYALYESGICLADIDITRSVNSRSSVRPAFRKYVSQLLNSTRLPRTTILVGLCYLATRLTMMSAGGKCSYGNGQIHRMLVISLLLGSKFLDDNTLKNRSWSEVSNIPTGELNLLEVEWLSAVNWDMHISPDDTQGFALWRKHWNSWQAGTKLGCKMFPKDISARSENRAHPSTLSSIFPHMRLYNGEAIGRVLENSTNSQQLMYRSAQMSSPHLRSEDLRSCVSTTGLKNEDWYVSRNRHVFHETQSPSYSTVLGSLSTSNISQSPMSANLHDQYSLQYDPIGWEFCDTCYSCRHCIVHYDCFSRMTRLQPQSIAV